MKTKRYYETPAMQVHNLSKFVPIMCLSAPPYVLYEDEDF